MNADRSKKLAGHALALGTIVVWGSTFISSKLLLAVYSPVQIMIMRFVLAYVVLSAVSVVLWFTKPDKRKKTALKDEALVFVMGLFGCTLYFMGENTALTYTLAANVSIIVAAAPILTAVLVHLFTKDEKLHKNVLLGFAAAFVGVALVVFNGAFVLKLNPIGDLLSLSAALCWAIYSLLLKGCVKRIPPLVLTRKLMFYGLITALPILFIQNKPFPIQALSDGTLLFNILFLGVIGSGICYITWSVATERIGTVVTSSYIYVNPFVTLVAAALFLGESISLMGVLGAVLIIAGVVISGKKPTERHAAVKEEA